VSRPTSVLKVETVASLLDGVPIECESRGTDAPTLVVVHGLAGDRSDFDGQVSDFQGSHRVFALDLPGNATRIRRGTRGRSAPCKRRSLGDLPPLSSSKGGTFDVRFSKTAADTIRDRDRPPAQLEIGWTGPIGSAIVEMRRREACYG
jgi:pimeloyl-ACP methyl ester carboxylesterase